MKIVSRVCSSLFVFILAAGVVLPGSARAQQPVYQWTTVAGQGGGPGIADGTGRAARFFGPSGTAVDAAGNVYVADTNNNLIRKVTSAGVVTTLAGSSTTFGHNDGTGSAAHFSRPSGIAVDPSGNVYVADTGNYAIRKITPAGVVTTLAGTYGAGDADGTGAAALFRSPIGIAIDGSGNLFVVDDMADTIRKVTAGGMVTTVAGKPDSRGVDGVYLADGQGSAARFFGPAGIAVDAGGNLYVADTFNSALRKITPGGAVTTVVRNSEDDPPVLPYGIHAVAVAAGGQIYIGDTFTIRKVSSAGAVTFVAGAGLPPNSNDGTGSAAGFYDIRGISVDAAGNVYVADQLNNTIRKVTSAGVVTTLAGSARSYGSRDGGGGVARFDIPSGIAVDAGGNLYVADYNNDTIRKATSAGVFSTLAGSVEQANFADGTGAAARFYHPVGVAVDAGGTAYVTDLENAAIRKVTGAGVVTTLAGKPPIDHGDNGFAAASAVAGSDATFGNPRGIAVAPNGTVFVCDEYGSIQKITPAGEVTTLAGQEPAYAYQDGTGTAAYFNRPLSIALDAAGNLFVADSFNYLIRKVTPAGVVTTVAGSPGVSAVVDGTGSGARFSFPNALAFDPAGNLLIGDSSTIRRMTPAGVVTTIGGAAGVTGELDGIGTAARFGSIGGITLARDGTVFFTDGNNRVLRGVPISAPAAPVYGRNPALYVVEMHDAPIVPNLPIPVSPQAAPTSYAITPALPPGLAFNTATGAITGAPSLILGPSGSAPETQVYTVTAANAAGTSPGTALTLGVTTQAEDWSWSNLAGQAQVVGGHDGTGAAAAFNVPVSAAVDLLGNIYITDFAGHIVRKITRDGVVSTLAGKTGLYGSADGTGSAARFNNPAGVAVDARGNVFIGDSGNSTIRKITPAGVVTTIAGLAGNIGSADGAGSAARFHTPKGVAVDAAGNLFVADLLNHTIRKITPAGVVSTLAGSAGQHGLVNATGSAARFNGPSGVAVDASGDLYVADARNSAIRKVTSAGVVTTITGRTGSSLPPHFDRPQDVAVDATGNLFVVDTSHNVICKITRDGDVTEIGGEGGSTDGYNNGIGRQARFAQPFGIAVSSTNRLFVADTLNQRIAKGVNTDTLITFAYGSSTLTFQAGQAIVPRQPTGIDDLPTHFSANPPLPAGLYLDPVTGQISGTPIVAIASTHYLITATNSGGTFQTGFTIVVNPGSAALAGSYSLVLGTGGNVSAAVVVTLSPGMTATGTVTRANGSRYPFLTGTLASDRTTSVALGDGSTLALAFNGIGRVSATLSLAGVVLSGDGSIAPPTVPPGLAGTYTVVLDPGTGGYGFALLTLTNKCGLIVAGRLPDGSAFLGNQGLLLDRDGNVAVFFLGDGTPHSLLSGALHFESATVSDNGVALKLKTASATVACDALGFMYTPTSSGLPPGNYPLTLQGAGISIVSTAGFDSFNHVSIAPPILGLQSSTSSGLANGLFSLQFRALGNNGQPTGPTLTGSGVYSQRLGQSFGQFTKDGQTGSVVIGPVAP